MAACSAKSFRTSDGFERLVECPICYDVLNEPKSLSCGHSVCQPCANRMTSGQRIITCPVCRVKTDVPVGGLPTNYTLAELVGQIVAQRQSRCHKCTVCDKMNSSDDICLCHSCNKVALCLSCAFKQHKDHKLQQLSDLIDNQRKEWEEWKNNKMNKKLETMEGKTQDMREIRVRSTVLCESLANKLKIDTSSWLKQSEDDLQKRLTHFKEKLNNIKESNLNQNNGYMFDFKALEDELQKIGDTQSQFLEKGQDLIDTVQSFEVKLNGFGIEAKGVPKSNSAGSLSTANRAQNRSIRLTDVLADYLGERSGISGTTAYARARRAAPVSIPRNTRNVEHEHEGETSSGIARIRIGSRTNQQSTSTRPARVAAVSSSSESDDDIGVSAARRRANYLNRVFADSDENEQMDDQPIDDNARIHIGSPATSPTLSTPPRGSVSPYVGSLSPGELVFASRSPSVSPFIVDNTVEVSDEDDAGPSTSTAARNAFWEAARSPSTSPVMFPSTSATGRVRKRARVSGASNKRNGSNTTMNLVTTSDDDSD